MDDIEGARPKVGLANVVRNNCPSYYDSRDIPGNAPATLHPKLNKVSHVCSNEDIEGVCAARVIVACRWAVRVCAPAKALCGDFGGKGDLVA